MTLAEPHTTTNNRPERLKDGNVAIIAGSGSLPGEAYRELVTRGRGAMLIGIEGEIDPRLARNAVATLTFGQLGSLFELLAAGNIQWVIFAGGISKRPDFRKMKLDMVTVKELPTVLKIAMGGDDSVLGKIAAYFEKRDLEVVGVQQVLPELLAREGNICGRVSQKQTLPSINAAFKAAKAIGALDAGQAAICEDGRVIALEGAEGTDAMIERVGALRQAGRISTAPKASVLAKVMKPKQDRRADLPAIGPGTIENIKSAGIKGIVLEADCSLILEREKTIEKAKQEKIFILGMKQPEAIG